MRPRRASASNGIVNRRVRLDRQTFILAGMAVFALWVAGSLVQGLVLNHSLNDQAALLRAQKCRAGHDNDGYRTDIAVVSSGAAAEERPGRTATPGATRSCTCSRTPPPATPAPSPARKPKR